MSRAAETGARRPERLLEQYRPDLAAMLDGHPAYRKRQVLEHLMRPNMPSFAEATALPADLRKSLDDAGSAVLQPAQSRVSADGTEKLLLACRDRAYVETVVMPYDKRTTACVSSQAGCPVGCAFCATGAAGLRRNLSAAEIVDQARFAAAASAASGSRLSNLVYMGMGEPMLNLQAVLSSLDVLTDPAGMGFGHRSISISTVGIPAGILRLAHAQPQVNLALSLHASSDKTRELLIPARHRHPLEDILAAAWQHFELTHRKLLVEYLLLRGVNDSTEDANRLAGLLRGHVVTVNLLTWNPVDVLAIASHGPSRKSGKRSGPRGADRRMTFSASPRPAVMAFRDALAARGIEVTIRASRGADIEGACGQLAGLLRSYQEGPEKPPPTQGV